MQDRLLQFFKSRFFLLLLGSVLLHLLFLAFTRPFDSKPPVLDQPVEVTLVTPKPLVRPTEMPKPEPKQGSPSPQPVAQKAEQKAESPKAPPAVKPTLSLRSSPNLAQAEAPEQEVSLGGQEVQRSRAALVVPQADLPAETSPDRAKQSSPSLAPKASRTPSSLGGVKADEVRTGNAPLEDELKAVSIRGDGENPGFKVISPQTGGRVAPGVGEAGFGKKTSRIEGEVASRKIIHRPPAPEVALERDVTISLKFRVQPSGEVDQAVPLQKGDVRLEEVAQDWILHTRFEPLQNSHQVQSGIIHVVLTRQKQVK